MQVKEIQSKKLFKEYLIEVPIKEIDDQVNLKLKELGPKTNLPGFRPGKAPLSLVKSKYEKDILGEIINKTVQENSKKLLNDKNLKPLRVPKIKITKFDKSLSLEFNIKIDLPPIFDLCDFKGIHLNKYEISISDKEIDDQYNNFLDSQKHYHSIAKDREIKNEDQVIISINSDEMNVPETLKQNDNLSIIIGSKFQIIPEIDKKLLNNRVKKNDEINIDLNIPVKNEKNKFSKHKFKVKIKDIKEPHKIKVDEEFLKKMNLKSINELKNQIKENLENQYKIYSQELTKKQLLDMLEKKHSFELPEGLLEDEFNNIWMRVEEAKKNKTLDSDDTNLDEKELKKRYEEIASRRVKLAIIVSTISEKNKIQVSEQEITNGIMEYAKSYPGQEKQIFEYFKKNPHEIETIRGPIFENKVLKFVIEKTKEVNKKINVKELHKIQSEIFKQV